MEHFGSLTLVSITVTRKLFTIFLSCIFYSHPLKTEQVFAIFVVFLGIALDAYYKDQEKKALKVKEAVVVKEAKEAVVVKGKKVKEKKEM